MRSSIPSSSETLTRRKPAAKCSHCSARRRSEIAAHQRLPPARRMFRTPTDDAAAAIRLLSQKTRLRLLRSTERRFGPCNRRNANYTIRNGHPHIRDRSSESIGHGADSPIESHCIAKHRASVRCGGNASPGRFPESRPQRCIRTVPLSPGGRPSKATTVHAESPA